MFNETEATIYVTPDGTEFRLDDTANDRWLNAISGLGMAPLRHLTRRGYGQDGETYLATQLNPRTVTLTVTERYASRGAMWAGHLAWIATMRPGDEAGTLRKVFPDGSAYELEVRFQSGLDPSSQDRFGRRTQSYTMQLVAHYPVWRALLPTEYRLVRGAGGELSFPIAFPVSFDSDNLLGKMDIEYEGSYRAWPSIELTGPLTNPELDHETLGVTVGLSYSIAAGEVVTLALDPTAPLVSDADGNNLVAYLSDASDLVGFYLDVGTNTIRLSATGVTSASAMVVRYYEQFLGV